MKKTIFVILTSLYFASTAYASGGNSGLVSSYLDLSVASVRLQCDTANGFNLYHNLVFRPAPNMRPGNFAVFAPMTGGRMQWVLAIETRAARSRGFTLESFVETGVPYQGCGRMTPDLLLISELVKN